MIKTLLGVIQSISLFSPLGTWAVDPYSLLTSAEVKLAINQNQSVTDPDPSDGHPMYEWLCFNTKLFNNLRCYYTDLSDDLVAEFHYELYFEVHPQRSRRTCYYFYDKFKSGSECAKFRDDISRLLKDQNIYCIYATYGWWVKPDPLCRHGATWIPRKIKTAKGELGFPE